jgi:hypothetical protein
LSMRKDLLPEVFNEEHNVTSSSLQGSLLATAGQGNGADVSRPAEYLRLLDSDWSLCHGKVYNQREWQEEGGRVLRRVPQQLPQGRHRGCSG